MASLADAVANNPVRAAPSHCGTANNDAGDVLKAGPRRDSNAHFHAGGRLELEHLQGALRSSRLYVGRVVLHNTFDVLIVLYFVLLAMPSLLVVR